MNQRDQEKSVLYIEDNPANLRLVEQILTNLQGVKMLTAMEPFSGMELAKQHLPDLILLDINLPDLDGYEIFKRLKNMEECKHIPIIAISANAMPKDIERGIEAGFDKYITKPVNVKDLMTTVEEILFNDE